MSRYEEFRLRLLESAATATRTSGHLLVTARGLANKHGIPQSHVQSELRRLAELRFIALTAWDGERERPYDSWPDASSLFSNMTDKGRVRIRLLSACSL